MSYHVNVNGVFLSQLELFLNPHHHVGQPISILDKLLNPENNFALDAKVYTIISVPSISLVIWGKRPYRWVSAWLQ